MVVRYFEMSSKHKENICCHGYCKHLFSAFSNIVLGLHSMRTSFSAKYNVRFNLFTTNYLYKFI